MITIRSTLNNEELDKKIKERAENKISLNLVYLSTHNIDGSRKDTVKSAGSKQACKNKTQNSKIKFESLNEEIKNDQLEEIDKYLEDIYEMRKDGLQKDGQYGTANLVFKEIRNKGYLDNLKDLKNKIISKELSLESLEEDYGEPYSDEFEEYFNKGNNEQFNELIDELNFDYNNYSEDEKDDLYLVWLGRISKDDYRKHRQWDQEYKDSLIEDRLNYVENDLKKNNIKYELTEIDGCYYIELADSADKQKADIIICRYAGDNYEWRSNNNCCKFCLDEAYLREDRLLPTASVNGTYNAWSNNEDNDYAPVLSDYDDYDLERRQEIYKDLGTSYLKQKAPTPNYYLRKVELPLGCSKPTFIHWVLNTFGQKITVLYDEDNCDVYYLANASKPDIFLTYERDGHDIYRYYPDAQENAQHTYHLSVQQDPPDKRNKIQYPDDLKQFIIKELELDMNESLDEAINYYEQEQKMQAWHEGRRKENLKAMSNPDKVWTNYNICCRDHYEPEATLLLEHAYNLQLPWAIQAKELQEKYRQVSIEEDDIHPVDGLYVRTQTQAGTASATGSLYPPYADDPKVVIVYLFWAMALNYEHIATAIKDDIVSSPPIHLPLDDLIEVIQTQADRETVMDRLYECKQFVDDNPDV